MKFEEDESEFELIGFTEEYLDGFPAPFVKESHIKAGLVLREEIPLAINNTILLIGEIQLLYLPDEVIDDVGMLNLEASKSVAISGLNNYYRASLLASHPYARRAEFQKKPS